MANPWHVNWLKEGVRHWNKRRKRISFRPELSGLNFFEILPPDFRDDPKTSRYFERIDLSDANLRGSDLSRLDFYKAKFDRANLEAANLTKSNFAQATFLASNLKDVSFEGSILTETKFEDVELQSASFEGVEATKVVFISAELSSSQRNQIGSDRVREYLSRIEFLSATRVAKSPGSGNVGGDFAQPSDRPKKNVYEVFFGTSRNPIFERGAVTGYGSEQWQNVNYGIAEVIVPDGKRLGSIGKSLLKRLFNKQPSDLRLKGLMTLNEDLFFSVLKDICLAGGPFQRPTIFVHGFNTSFEGAVLRAAQFGHDLGLVQGIGLFSWPSKGTEIGYPSDEGSAERNKYALSEFLEKFIAAFPDHGISVVAHSMGCRCLLGAIEVLASTKKEAAQSIHQIIFAAADVDAAIMPHQGKHAISNADRTTSYVGDRDQALMLSRLYHDFDRVGLVPPAFTMPGMDTVLVNDSELGWLAHGYIGSSRAVLADVHALLTKNEPPEVRFSMRRHSIAGAELWKLAD